MTHSPDSPRPLSLQAMSTGSTSPPNLSLLSPLLPLNAAALVRFVFNISVISQTYIHKYTDRYSFLRYPKSFSHWISSSCLNWYYRNLLSFILYLHVSSHSWNTLEADTLDYPWVCVHHVRLIDSRCFINDSIDDTRSCNYPRLHREACLPKESHFRNQQVRTIVWPCQPHQSHNSISLIAELILVCTIASL